MAIDINNFWGVAPYQRPSADEVADVQRRRLMLGITRVVAAKGYAAASVADVLASVRVSRRTFYELFKDKEDCFIAAYDVAHAALVRSVRDSQRGVEDAISRIEAAHRAYLEFLQRDPELSAAMLIGILNAGHRAAERREAAHVEFARLHVALSERCRTQFPDLPKVPAPAFVALVGGTNKVVASEIRQGRAGRVTELLPVVLYLTYSVYGLWQHAGRVSEAVPERLRNI